MIYEGKTKVTHKTRKTIGDLLGHFQSCPRCQKQTGIFCKAGENLMEVIDSEKHTVTAEWLHGLGSITEGQRQLLNNWCGGSDWVYAEIPAQAAHHIERCK